MNTIVVFVFPVTLALLLLFKLLNTALNRRANVRAGARLGPGSFFFEVKDQEKEESPKK